MKKHKLLRWWKEREGFNKCTPIQEFDGGYGRYGIIWIEDELCGSCKKKKPVLCIDQSEGEYKVATICHACLDDAFMKASTVMAIDLLNAQAVLKKRTLDNDKI